MFGKGMMEQLGKEEDFKDDNDEVGKGAVAKLIEALKELMADDVKMPVKEVEIKAEKMPVEGEGNAMNDEKDGMSDDEKKKLMEMYSKISG